MGNSSKFLLISAKFCRTFLVAGLTLLAASTLLGPRAHAKPGKQPIKQPIKISNLKAQDDKPAPLASYTYIPEVDKSKDHMIEQVMTNDSALKEMSDRYRTMAVMREHRKNYQINSLQDEVNYVNETRNMVRGYITRTFRGHLKRAAVDLKNAFREDIQAARSEEREAQGKRKNVTFVSNQVKGNGPSKQTNTGTRTGIIRTTTAEDKSVARKSNSGDDALEKALAEIVRFGHNVVEEYETIQIADNTEARMHFDLPRTTMQVNFVSPVVDADAQYRVGRGTLPMSGSDPNVGDRTSIGVSRQFSEIALGTGMRYGVESSTVNYGVSKHIHGPLSAGVNRSHCLRDSAQNNTTVSLNVGLAF